MIRRSASRFQKAVRKGLKLFLLFMHLQGFNSIIKYLIDIIVTTSTLHMVIEGSG